MFHLISSRETTVTGEAVEHLMRNEGSFLLSGCKGVKKPRWGLCQLQPQIVFFFPYNHTNILITKIIKIVELIKCIYEAVIGLGVVFCLDFFFG